MTAVQDTRHFEPGILDLEYSVWSQQVCIQRVIGATRTRRYFKGMQGDNTKAKQVELFGINNIFTDNGMSVYLRPSGSATLLFLDADREGTHGRQRHGQEAQ